MRLRRSDPGRPGYGRRRRGRGWLFLDPSGQPVRDPDQLGRLRELVIPPAWRDVWICPYPNGHIQATGVDAAGRKQYLYHPKWREKRDEAKFDHVLEVARRLPVLRERVGRDLSGRGLHRDRVLATVTRLLDMGMFRVGSDQYAAGDDPTFGVSTLRPEHARSRDGYVVFEFPAKGGIEQVCRIEDPELCRVLTNLRRQRRAADRLFGYRDGEDWRDVRSDEVNEYLRDASGGEMTAKDFRTWHATVLAATELATAGSPRSATARKRAVAGVMRAVAELLGNTPTVARTSYVDPRVVDLFHGGVVAPVDPGTARENAERIVLELLEDA
ncbi:DNA topoisomerase IB [Micromonospora peucetia]|uniref:DNA topoisomerase n=1 Tax=Micromonospora peucetia TaxID=47871 RepID=A0A1C6W5S6_9ACTN|nr:DNA topoisomerase IB [Micromonospora peucetia]MCX4385495.1 DNA topoisomerase IB [Micromonospora peucetia]WSA32888.1 DNA topoisomerase IB [Micromonospora peucetia]SCL73892.1 DNA topoisomerase IB [Micromonospora peucetia]